MIVYLMTPVTIEILFTPHVCYIVWFRKCTLLYSPHKLNLQIFIIPFNKFSLLFITNLHFLIKKLIIIIIIIIKLIVAALLIFLHIFLIIFIEFFSLVFINWLFFEIDKNLIKVAIFLRLKQCFSLSLIDFNFKIIVD